MEELKGSVSKETIVHEHDGFRTQIHDFQTYLESCLPVGTKWGPYTDVVASGTQRREWDGREAERLIEVLVAAFLQHVSEINFTCGLQEGGSNENARCFTVLR